MKNLLLIISGLIIVSTVSAEELSMLTCPRQEALAEKVDEINGSWCEKAKFSELEINDILQVELDYFDEEAVNKIMLEDVSNPNWLSQKGVYDLRENKICLENICDMIQNKCNTKNNIGINNTQNAWCRGSIENIFEIQKIKIKTAVIENQKRKTRSAKREKYREIEVRMHRYFVNNLIDFTNGFKAFTERVTAFILKPLQ